ncbi:PREDICTED: general transcription factor 3C polypeptide 5-like isoform X2 [Ipomoea nil]|uniref:general transcription factor 3C polypeptide 5-like isoform X2 n=1 Tax=Ipomoea nil TaxID=35883 RepID=UPI0009019A19|nr:PREDICTED: general transcription factor 3C polypeptide 5-like isoform X2 [Ipomoea nil]
MGIIKDGSISGVLPGTGSSSNSDNVFVVHYPAYPSSLQRAVETLGGTEAIVKARSSQSNKLELRFRPEDPYSHPTFGKLKQSVNFLLKITKEKVSAAENTDTNNRLSKCSSVALANTAHAEPNTEFSKASEQGNEFKTLSADGKDVDETIEEALQEHLSADIVAQVSEAYHFNGMADYQHVLAVHADVARRKKRNWDEVEPNFEKSSHMDVHQEDLMILVPPFFSLKDIPENIMLKPTGILSSKKRQEGVVQQRWEMEIEPCLAIDFNIKDIPKKVNWEKYIPEGTVEWVHQKAVSKFFDERPVWAKESLTELLLEKGIELREGMLKRLLFREAYYFSQGPFRRLWIRKGYDPRTDPESRIYQSVDFRVSQPSLQRYCEAQAESGVKLRWKDICSFKVFPSKCQTSLQLFELVDDYIQEEIKKPPKKTTCSCQTGWFASNVLKSIRLRVAIRFISVYPNPGADSFLKSVSARFEKAKRPDIYTKNVISEGEEEEEEEEEDVDQEMENNEDNEADDGEEDEAEDDNAEEDKDAYEGLDMVI